MRAPSLLHGALDNERVELNMALDKALDGRASGLLAPTQSTRPTNHALVECSVYI